MFRFLTLFICLTTSAAATPADRPGWEVHETSLPYAELITKIKSSVKDAKFGVVTEAGPTAAAKARGITIPGNRVIGVFNNIYAVRMLNASEAAMIEAPIRFYVTENTDDTAVLSYKTPSFVFEPYAEDSPDVMAIAHELDGIFAKIAAEAVAQE